MSAQPDVPPAVLGKAVRSLVQLRATSACLACNMKKACSRPSFTVQTKADLHGLTTEKLSIDRPPSLTSPSTT